MTLLTLPLGCAGAPGRVTKSVSPSDPVAPSARQSHPAVHGDLSVLSHKQLVADPSFPFLTSGIAGPTGCELSGLKVAPVVSADFHLDCDLEIDQSDGSKRVVPILPKSRFVGRTWGAPSPIGCDPASRRIFVANTTLGYVMALSVDGDRLWTRYLPGFVSLETDTTVASEDLTSLLRGLKGAGSTVTKIIPSGEHVAVQFWTRRQEITQVVYHRSGALVGTVGPWDGVLLDALPNGWRFASGFSSGAEWPTAPTHELEIGPSGRQLGKQIEHFLAWLSPLPSDQRLVWHRCNGLLPEQIEFRLGSEYDDRMSLVAKEVHDELGVNWFNRVLARSGVSELAATADVNSEEWIKSWHRALLGAGVDVDLISAIQSEVEGPSPSSTTTPNQAP
jgi:hypothetical protein